jgi:ribosome-binding protein aMBF1 (putative translation factor)
MAGGRLVGFTIVKGGALLGIRLCNYCKDNFYQMDTKESPKCKVCDHIIREGIQVNLCKLCSAETGVCQDCGATIGTDNEVTKKKRKGKKDVQQNSENAVRVSPKRRVGKSWTLLRSSDKV